MVLLQFFSRCRIGEPETDSPLLSLPLELIASAVRGSMSFLLNMGSRSTVGMGSPEVAGAAGSEQGVTELLRIQVTEDLRTFFASVGGLQSLMQDIAPAVFRASATEVKAPLLLVLLHLLLMTPLPVATPVHSLEQFQSPLFL